MRWIFDDFQTNYIILNFQNKQWFNLWKQHFENIVVTTSQSHSTSLNHQTINSSITILNDKDINVLPVLETLKHVFCASEELWTSNMGSLKSVCPSIWQDNKVRYVHGLYEITAFFGSVWQGGSRWWWWHFVSGLSRSPYPHRLSALQPVGNWDQMSGSGFLWDPR